MRKFAIFYNDGTVIYGGGEDDEAITLTFSRKWLEAPSDGVSHINVEDEVIGRQPLKGHEFYYQLPINSHGDGCIGGSMKVGPYLRQIGVVKFGGWTSSKTFRDIGNKAHRDTYVKPSKNSHREPDEDTSD